MHLGYLRLRELLNEFEKERIAQNEKRDAPHQPTFPERWRRSSQSSAAKA